MIIDIKHLQLERGKKEEKHRYYNAHHPNLRHLSIDLESECIEGKWRAREIAIFDHQKKRIILHHYIDYGDSLSSRQDSIPLKELLRILKIVLSNSVVFCWNANKDIKALPQIEYFSLGVHCAMIRFSRVMNTTYNIHHKDRGFMDLYDAAKQIGISFNWHVCCEDAMAASYLWEYCDEYDLPRDYEISKAIDSRINFTKATQLLLEFSDEEIGINYQASENLAHLRSAFRKPKPYYKSDHSHAKRSNKVLKEA